MAGERPLRPRRGDAQPRAAADAELAGSCLVGAFLGPRDAERREQQLSDLVGFFQMRIARRDDRLDTERLVLTKPLGNGLGIADERGSRTCAHEANARPKVGGNDEPVSLAAAVQRTHPLLSDRVGIDREPLLRGFDRIVGQVADQLVCRPPGLGLGLPNDEVDAQSEPELAAARLGAFAHDLDLLGDLGRRLAPGQVRIDMLGRNIDGRIGRAAEPDRRGRLHGGEIQPRALHRDVLAGEVDRLVAQQTAVDGQEFRRVRVALVMAEEDAVAFELRWIAAGNDIDEKAPIADAIERGGLAGCKRRRGHARPKRDEKFELLREWRKGCSRDPGIIATAPRGNEHALVS